jgi:hypothetical protein
MRLRPWGPIRWLFEKVEHKKWHAILSLSFEERCLSLPLWLDRANHQITSACVLRIENPPSKLWSEAKPKIETHSTQLLALLAKSNLSIFHTELVSHPPAQFDQELINNATQSAVILDITTMPKRFFLFALKRLLSNTKVKDLVVTYGRAKTYPELALCEDALPPSALPGFGRIETEQSTSRLIVGVGYVALSVEDLLEKAKHQKLDYLFPFPPASPAFRRNWSLLSRLIPADFPRTTEIHRIHGMDAFEVFEKTLAWGQNYSLDMLPLGPKPHSLGMAMAHLRLAGHAELIYAQPQAYRPDYSLGIQVDERGMPDLFAYYLKRDGKQLF